ncbi:MAG: ABC transporter ATP-binding protein [Clostridia bacterium]|nr:ABC transporter ATP-binding protein [Clostridia bacterium]
MSIRIEHLSKAFDGKKVLENFSCELPEQGVVAMMGRSGIGKSTLINLLLGLRKPDSGKIILPHGLKFSVVFQEDRLIEHMTARDNLLLTTGREKEEIDEVLSALSLNPEETASVKTYSGGMKRRVALARGILYEADVLLLDEPFRGLDAETREQAMELVKNRWRGRLVLLVTHDEQEARSMGAERIIIIGGSADEQ